MGLRFPPVRVGEIEIRPLRPGDARSWSQAMRANEHRMRPWWPPTSDWQRCSSTRAFARHYVEVRRREMRGTGLCLAITDSAGFAGEWEIWRAELRAEIGVWFRDVRAGKELIAAAAGITDLLIGGAARRLDAPVAVGNAGPRSLLRMFGYQLQATIPEYRPVGGQLVDFDLFGLTRAGWEDRRRSLYREMPWPQLSSSLEPLG